MPVTYEILSDLVVFTASDRVTSDDFRRVMEKAVSDSRFVKGSKMLTYDIESALEPSTADPLESAANLGSFLEYFSPRMAVVVHKKESMALGELIGRHCKEYGIEFRAFDDPGKAKEWLYPGGF